MIHVHAGRDGIPMPGRAPKPWRSWIIAAALAVLAALGWLRGVV